MQKEIILHPGELYFGKSGEIVKTLLGSCIAITLWHPKLQIGGMCHYVLPEKSKFSLHTNNKVLEPRYGSDAIAMFVKKIRQKRTHIKDYQVKIFGGGNMFPYLSADTLSVGERNIEIARTLLLKYGFSILAEHVGDFSYRYVIFNITTGETLLRWKSVKEHK